MTNVTSKQISREATGEYIEDSSDVYMVHVCACMALTAIIYKCENKEAFLCLGPPPNEGTPPAFKRERLARLGKSSKLE